MDKTALAHLGLLLNSFPAKAGQDIEMCISAYEVALDGQRPKHIVLAIKKFLKGEVKGQSKRFAPTTAELLDEVKGQAESQRLNALPSRKAAIPTDETIPDEAERERVKAKMAALVKKLADDHKAENEKMTPEQKAMWEKANQRIIPAPPSEQRSAYRKGSNA